jgi:hypothetical protein
MINRKSLNKTGLSKSVSGLKTSHTHSNSAATQERETKHKRKNAIEPDVIETEKVDPDELDLVDRDPKKVSPATDEKSLNISRRLKH